ncbi:glycosyltransferase family 4 protein [Terrarubrum flagellatum]|uniref:glycosyltransferase family 4 protein n=1 Tax=Terrirubrum flagellatum TaxID=2895980 RepID=UPI0031454627
MPQAFFVIPGDLSSPTGGYAYDRRVLALAEKYEIDLRHLPLSGAWPAPTAEDIAAAAAAIAATPGDSILLIDGLAYGAMPTDLIRGFHRPVVALVHHPLGLEAGLNPARAQKFLQTEKEALALAESIIVTSAITGKTLIDDFGVSSEKIIIAEPGVDEAPRAHGSGGMHILAVGSVIPRKAYDVLIDAMARIADRDWTLSIVGGLNYAPETVAQVREMISDHALDGRVKLLGALSADQLASAYDGADLFVMSSLYEGYGMVATEALARGLPVVSTTGGALADTVPFECGLKVPPGDAIAFSDAVARMIDDHALRQRCADAAWAHAATLPRWSDTAAAIASVLYEVMRGLR